MFTIAITGTNGKTTTVELARQYLSILGGKPASLGTLGITSEDFSESDPVLLGKHAITKLITELRDYYQIDTFLFEAFSDSLASRLYDNVSVDLALLTNLGDDHLDYHKSRKNYFEAKLHLFTHILKPSGTAIYNSDGDFAEKIRLIGEKRKIKLFSFGFAQSADLRILKIKGMGLKSEVTIVYNTISYKAELPFIGECFVLNWAGATALALAMDIPIDTIVESAKKISLPPGRLEHLGIYNEASVYLDYAHNGHALEAVLKTMKSRTTGNLHLVFGCGGDRDKSRRSEMGRLAERLADKVVVTDDNPRKEEAAAIRREICFKCPKAIDIAGRKEAIQYALHRLKPGDVLLIAGKGSERFQEIDGTKIRHCDKESVLDFLRQSRHPTIEEQEISINY